MINKLYIKYKEIIWYLIFGILTTIVSLITYFLLTYTVIDVNNPFMLQIANIISWITCVTFAYFTNKKYVFKKKEKSLKETLTFYLSRLSTLLLDILLMFILVTILNMNDNNTTIHLRCLLFITDQGSLLFYFLNSQLLGSSILNKINLLY